MEKSRRVVNIDILRISAALMVFICHWGQCIGLMQLNIGRRGVELFFILSGYLICSSLQKNTSLKSFYIKRAIRILPAYYMTLVGIWLFDIGLYLLKGYTIREIFCNVCGVKFIRYFGFLQCVIPSENWDLWNNRYALWTMSSFAFFYLCAPLLVKLCKKWEVAFGLTFLLMLGREPIASIIEKWLVGYSHIEYFALMNPINELYCFMLGITLYVAIKQAREIPYAGILAVVMVYTEMQWFAYEILFVIIVLLLIKIPSNSLNKQEGKIIGFLSDSSFALYLLHPVMFKALSYANIILNMPKVLYASVLLIVPLIFVGLFHMYVEKPLTKRLQKCLK